MAKTFKQAKEELEQETQQLIEEADKVEEAPVEEVVEETPAEEPPQEEAPAEEQPEKEEIVEEAPVEEVPEAKEEVIEEPDYKEKFINSSREAQILAAKNRKMNEAIDKAAELPEPTEEELQQEFTDWDLMSDTEKRLAKETVKSNRFQKLMLDARKETKDVEAWTEKVDGFITNPENLVSYPQLEGKVEEFRLFATKPTRRGVDFEDLVPAFLFSAAKEAKPKKGKMFETGSGGPNDKPSNQDGKISVSESETLRKTDYKKYIEYLKAGKINNQI